MRSPPGQLPAVRHRGAAALAVARANGCGGFPGSAALLAIAQACWVTFAVTYLVVVLGLSLSVAGLVFAVMQATSVLGRIALGWIADHVASSTTTLAIAAVGSALSTIRSGWPAPGWPLWAFVAARRRRRHRGVRLERRADRRGGAALAARADRRDGGRRGHPGFHDQHADAGRLRGLRRDHRPLRSGVLRRPGLSAWSACRCSTAWDPTASRAGR